MLTARQQRMDYLCLNATKLPLCRRDCINKKRRTPGSISWTFHTINLNKIYSPKWAQQHNTQLITKTTRCIGLPLHHTSTNASRLHYIPPCIVLSHSENEKAYFDSIAIGKFYQICVFSHTHKKHEKNRETLPCRSMLTSNALAFKLMTGAVNGSYASFM